MVCMSIVMKRTTVGAEKLTPCILSVPLNNWRQCKCSVCTSPGAPEGYHGLLGYYNIILKPHQNIGIHSVPRDVTVIKAPTRTDIRFGSCSRSYRDLLIGQIEKSHAYIKKETMHHFNLKCHRQAHRSLAHCPFI